MDSIPLATKVASDDLPQLMHTPVQVFAAADIEEQAVGFRRLIHSSSGSEPLALPRQPAECVAIRLLVILQKMSTRDQALSLRERHTRSHSLTSCFPGTRHHLRRPTGVRSV